MIWQCSLETMRSRIWMVLSGWRPTVLNAPSSNSWRLSLDVRISFGIRGPSQQAPILGKAPSLCKGRYREFGREVGENAGILRRMTTRIALRSGSLVLLVALALPACRRSSPPAPAPTPAAPAVELPPPHLVARGGEAMGTVVEI